MLIWLDGELKTRSQITSNMIGQGQCPIALVYEYVCACSKVISIRCNGRCLSESRLSELANRLLRIPSYYVVPGNEVHSIHRSNVSPRHNRRWVL